MTIISTPPDVAPVLKTVPIPTAITTPPATPASRGFSVMTGFPPVKKLQISIVPEIVQITSIVDESILKPNFLHAMRRSGTLKQKYRIPVDIPEILLITIARPDIPPGASESGFRNSATPDAYMTAPSTIVR